MKWHTISDDGAAVASAGLFTRKQYRLYIFPAIKSTFNFSFWPTYPYELRTFVFVVPFHIVSLVSVLVFVPHFHEFILLCLEFSVLVLFHFVSFCFAIELWCYCCYLSKCLRHHCFYVTNVSVYRNILLNTYTKDTSYRILVWQLSFNRCWWILYYRMLLSIMLFWVRERVRDTPIKITANTVQDLCCTCIIYRTSIV